MILLGAFLFVVRKKITLYRITAFIVILIIIAIGQNTSDYYMNNTFYDLQNNWHYFAYASFVLVMYRVLIRNQVPPDKIIRITYLKALLISFFDEGIQVFISSRVFDLSDIAKDMIGVCIGLIALFFIYRQGDITKHGWKVRYAKIKEYFLNPLPVLLILVIFSYVFLFVSSNLADDKYWLEVVLLSFGLTSVIVFIIHLSRQKIPAIILKGLAVTIILTQTVSYFMYKNDNFTYHSGNLTIYKGIPLYYFDYMIFPDGFFRPVDRKSIFKGGDISNFFSHKSDILLVGTGEKVEGNHGFIGSQYVQNPYFIYNPDTRKGLQVILLPSYEACKEYNRLCKEGYKVLFVLHNK